MLQTGKKVVTAANAKTMLTEKTVKKLEPGE